MKLPDCWHFTTQEQIWASSGRGKKKKGNKKNKRRKEEKKGEKKSQGKIEMHKTLIPRDLPVLGEGRSIPALAPSGRAHNPKTSCWLTLGAHKSRRNHFIMSAELKSDTQYHTALLRPKIQAVNTSLREYQQKGHLLFPLFLLLFP